MSFFMNFYVHLSLVPEIRTTPKAIHLCFCFLNWIKHNPWFLHPLIIGTCWPDFINLGGKFINFNNVISTCKSTTQNTG